MASSSNSNSDTDLASLPRDLLDSILDKLAPMEDYLAFSEVCSEWQHAVCEKLEDARSNHERHCRLHQQAPLLVAPTADGQRLCLYDVIQRKSVVVCEFKLRSGQRRCRLEGSSHGWLILLDVDSQKLILLNPLSGETIHLPPLKDAVITVIRGGERRRVFSPKRMRCVLSVDPDHVNRKDEEVVVMVMCKAYEQKIAFIKLGDEDWTYVEQFWDFEDIACINGNGNGSGGLFYFYAVDRRGVPFSCSVKVNNNNNNNGNGGVKVKLRWIPSPGDGGRHQYSEQYLVEYLAGDILRIVEKKADDQYLVESPEGDLLRIVEKNADFIIYKLMWFTRNPRWEEVMDLGDVALFLGDNHSISVRASDIPGCSPNSIYFCGCNGFSNDLDGRRYVFSLTDRTLNRLPSHPPHPLLWISSKFVF